jgi:hypothetical protein
MNDENTQSVFQVDFRIYGIDPKKLDSLFGVDATMARKKGDRRTLPSGKSVCSNTTVWRLRSQILSNDLNDHMDYFIKKLDLKANGEEIGRVAEAVMLDVLIIRSESGNEGKPMELQLSSHNIKIMACCGMKLSIVV